MRAADTVVVGAGSSGCVIAARLSEDPSHQVLLLEAGPDHHADHHPDLAGGIKNSMTEHDWGFKHRVHTKARLKFPFPRGRVVGGSSAVNTCIGLRGHPRDFDAWAELGLTDWSFEQCLPAFKAIERDLDVQDDFHGSDGPLPLRRHPPEEWVPWQTAFVEAAVKLGFAECFDSNHPDSTGVGPHAMNKIAGRRISAAEAWLTPEVRARSNLHIVDEATVHKLLVSGTHISGIRYERGGRLQECNAQRVVLSAGAIASPGILMASGIGPHSQLKRLGIETLVDSPAVSARLLDHPGVALFVWPKSGVVKHGDPLIQTTLRVSDGFPNDLMVQPGSYVYLPKSSLPLASVMAQLGKPKGHGLLSFEGPGPVLRPRIDSRLLEHPEDLKQGVRALELAYELASHPSMKRCARQLYPRPSTLQRPERLARALGRLSDSGYHPAGTIPMGPKFGDTAAADGRGQVYGVRGLYVADTSLMPTLTSSNTHLPTLMMAHRIAEWLAEAVC